MYKLYKHLIQVDLILFESNFSKNLNYKLLEKILKWRIIFVKMTIFFLIIITIIMIKQGHQHVIKTRKIIKWLKKKYVKKYV